MWRIPFVSSILRHLFPFERDGLSLSRSILHTCPATEKVEQLKGKYSGRVLYTRLLEGRNVSINGLPFLHFELFESRSVTFI